MDDIFNILFFVVTIIIFIISAIRKNKKGSQKPKNSIQSSIESFFDIPQEEIKVETNDFMQQVSINKDDLEEIEIPKKVTRDFTEAKSVIPDEIKEDEIGRPSEAGIEFDLRSAIIYKEILNRKEF